jgi:hypothetical protein
MTIQRAIRSGKPFHRKDDPNYYVVANDETGEGLFIYNFKLRRIMTKYGKKKITPTSILANDWEIKK